MIITMWRKAAGALLIVPVLLVLGPVLGGCSTLTNSVTATVPTTGPIEQGQQVGVNPEDHFIRVIARGPSEGMTPTQIVSGFLEASASFDDDHAVARQYLTAEASRGWDTDAGVRIYDGAADLTDLAQTVVLTAALTGEISPIGHLDITPPGELLHAEFTVVRVAGEWRIDALPPGLQLSQQDVDRAFRSYAVYFFNPQFDMLVPDPRMVPITGSSLATTLVRRLVDGPSAWLEPAVRTGLPAGVGLNIDSVPVDAGVARVDLTANARKAGEETRQAISQQLVWTLRQIPDVQKVEITAAGQPLTVTGHPSPQGRDTWPSVDPNAMPPYSKGYVTRPEGVALLVADEIQPVRGGFGTGEVPLVDFAVAADESRIAGISDDGSVWQAVVQDDSQPIRIRDSGPAVSVAFDRSEAAWVVDGDEGLIAITANGNATPVRVQGIGRTSTLLAAVPSRDGTRAALIVQRGPRTVLLMARIVRGAGSAASITVSAPRRVESQLAEVLDLSWSASDTLSVLGSQTPGTVQNYDLSLSSGVLTPNASPVGPITVAAAPGLPTLIGSTDGLTYENDSGAWVERVRGIAPTYPG